MTSQETEKAAYLEIAISVMQQEAFAVHQASSRLGNEFGETVELISRYLGKIVVTGVGKSGYIARKIVATLCSTGTQAVFLHPLEAVHGDLGIYTPGDPTILISKSGSSSELIRLVPILREFKSPLIGIIGNRESWLAQAMDLILDASVPREADPYSLVPTSSTTVALVIGDALAVALMKARGFTPQDFVKFHPSGQLGRNLLKHVEDIMHKGDQVSWVTLQTSLKEVVIGMTKHPLGAALVVDENHHLSGIITDGDLRRALLDNDDIRRLKAGDIMTPEPIAVDATASINDALHLMENRPNQISVLPVFDQQQVCIGLIRIHDIYLSGEKPRNDTDTYQTSR